MKLNPVYGDTPVLTIEPGLVEPVALMIQQRDRLAAALSALADDQWAAPSRCEGWSGQDVMTHLVSTNQFWTFSINLGLAGQPSRFLADFDPVASPAQLVNDAPATPPAETLTQFLDTNAALAAAAAAIGDQLWIALGESPPGHVSLGALNLHALWDSWIHERDILLPLGIEPVRDDDEIRANLIYTAALSPMFAASANSGRQGAIEVRATNPDISFVVEVGATVRIHGGAAPEGAALLAGDAVALIEAMSFRGSWPFTVAADEQWLFDGLGEIFDVAN
ncbi:MAG: maleylpyruvate isomerase N-terminal domain-containing protein [Acidimicrobiia bacterium]|nr:maleylpyruvate isomerase N-terminal domain-containing protein [Acidimicrobiia bacterium]